MYSCAVYVSCLLVCIDCVLCTVYVCVGQCDTTVLVDVLLVLYYCMSFIVPLSNLALEL